MIGKLMTMGLVLLVRIYQWTLRPFIGAHCRYEPSCSHYAIEALRRHGAGRGAGLAAWRVLRCNPWTRGGYDPVPERHGSCDSFCAAARPGEAACEKATVH